MTEFEKLYYCTGHHRILAIHRHPAGPFLCRRANGHTCPFCQAGYPVRAVLVGLAVDMDDGQPHLIFAGRQELWPLVSSAGGLRVVKRGSSVEFERCQVYPPSRCPDRDTLDRMVMKAFHAEKHQKEKANPEAV